MSEDPVPPTPAAMTLEPCRLQALADELGDSTPALRFLSTYLSMLPDRIRSISSGLCTHDVNASMDAILSLKITSGMVGALETEGQCRAMEMMIREDHFDSAVQRSRRFKTRRTAVLLQDRSCWGGSAGVALLHAPD